MQESNCAKCTASGHKATSAPNLLRLFINGRSSWAGLEKYTISLVQAIKITYCRVLTSQNTSSFPLLSESVLN